MQKRMLQTMVVRGKQLSRANLHDEVLHQDSIYSSNAEDEPVQPDEPAIKVVKSRSDMRSTARQSSGFHEYVCIALLNAEKFPEA